MNIGQHIIGGFEGTQITKKVKTLIQKYEIGGLILFSRNIESPRQLRALNLSLQKLSRIPLFLGVDQEGGVVARLRKGFTEIPPMGEVGDYFLKTKNIKTVEQIGRILGREVRAVGFNWDYAPVVDVHSRVNHPNPKNLIIGKRSFSSDPLIVTRCAEAVMKGLHAEHVLSCAKHFPGHGATSADSHKSLPVLRDSKKIFWERDLIPYRQLISRGVIQTLMTAHIRYTNLDPKNCATLSHKILTGLLRQKLKFNGLIVSDDLLMKAIADHHEIPEAAYQFLSAGGDMAAICKDPELQIEVIEFIRQKLSSDKKLAQKLDEAASRIQRLKKTFCRKGNLPDLKVIGSAAHQRIIEKI